MNKIIEAEDILHGVRNCAECIFLAASDIGGETDPIQAVADIASTKINEAIALLVECRKAESAEAGTGSGCRQVSPAARTKRSGK